MSGKYIISNHVALFSILYFFKYHFPLTSIFNID